MSLRAGVIGCGSISRFHFDGIEKADGKVMAICDLDDEATRPFAEKYGCEVSTDWKAVTDDPDIEVVHVTVFSRLHREICLRAIEQGKAVICEKTLTEDPADSLEVIEAARKRGVVFYTSYMKRFIPAVQKTVELLPTIGRLMAASIRSYQGWGNNWEGEPAGDFFNRPETGESAVKRAYGGGILVCGGSHILDLVCHLFGRPSSLYATQFEPEYLDLDLEATALIKTPSCPVQFQAVAHPLSKIGFLKDGWDEGYVISGTRGRLEFFSSNWSEVETKASRLVHYCNESGSTKEYLFEPSSPFASAIRYFYGNIEQGVQGDQSAATGYDVDKLIQAITESAQTGSSVDLDWEIDL
jgi:predicted dehydrogenase